MLHSLQFGTDGLDITHESSLGGPALGLCSAWRFGDFGRFGDLFNFQEKMVLYIMTRVIKYYVNVDALNHKMCEYSLRVRIS